MWEGITAVISVSKKAIEYGTKCEDWDGVGNAYLNMGFAYSCLQKKQEAISSTEKAVEYCTRAKDWRKVSKASQRLIDLEEL